jgi:hypothetical protein
MARPAPAPATGLSIVGWGRLNPAALSRAWSPRGLPVSEAICKAIPLAVWAFLRWGPLHGLLAKRFVEPPLGNAAQTTQETLVVHGRN